MKNLKNLTIASTLCISTCITLPTLTSAMIRPNSPKPSSNFKTRNDYMKFTSTGGGKLGSRIQTRIVMLESQNAPTKASSKPQLPKNSVGKLITQFESKISISSNSSSKNNSNTQSKVSNSNVSKLKKIFEN